MPYTVKTKVKELMQEKGLSYSQAELSKKTGLTRQTVVRVFGDQAERIDMTTLAALLDFFAAEGMPVTVADLFTVTVA
jgi:transcriptional regulator with XRE-family HTH domain